MDPDEFYPGLDRGAWDPLEVDESDDDLDYIDDEEDEE